LLDRSKFDVVVASTVEDGSLRPLFERNNISLHIGSRSKDGGRLGVALKLIKFVKEYQPDIIHTHLFGGDIFGWLFKVVLRTSAYWISTQHNVEFRTSLLRRFIWRYILRCADQVIAVADKVKQYDIEHFGLKDKNVKVVKNGIDIEELSHVPVMLKRGEKWQLGIVGRLQEQKGHIYLIEALSKLNENNWVLHVFGDGPDKDHLLALATEKHITDRIVWHGVEANLSHLYESVDIIIQPSLWEGLSLVIMEALCAGRFVIASEAAGEELIVNKQDGLLVHSKNIEDIVAALHYSFAHSSEIEQIATSARLMALHNFDIRNNVQKIADLYEFFVSKRK